MKMESSERLRGEKINQVVMLMLRYGPHRGEGFESHISL